MTAAYATATATGAMTTVPTCLHGIYIESTSGSLVVAVTDGNGGAAVCTIAVGASNAAQSYIFPEPIFLQNGVYVTVTGSGPKVTIAYT
jgi:hypothetical protein